MMDRLRNLKNRDVVILTNVHGAPYANNLSIELSANNKVDVLVEYSPLSVITLLNNHIKNNDGDLVVVWISDMFILTNKLTPKLKELEHYIVYDAIDEVGNLELLENASNAIRVYSISLYPIYTMVHNLDVGLLNIDNVYQSRCREVLFLIEWFRDVLSIEVSNRVTILLEKPKDDTFENILDYYIRLAIIELQTKGVTTTFKNFKNRLLKERYRGDAICRKIERCILIAEENATPISGNLKYGKLCRIYNALRYKGI